ncbi:hypothetical protein [Lysinibacillus sphaericus]|uniref:hypothetical protein n=1 Tax=Lysinibacillus sphaericus TaxID=1421 RepID=UPI003CFDEC3B
MQQTQNYKLNKPEITDYAKIELLNDNADIIDAKLKDLEINGDLTEIVQTVANLQQEVTDNKSEFTEHLADDMPHKYTNSDNGKTYRLGFGVDAGGFYYIQQEVE